MKVYKNKVKLEDLHLKMFKESIHPYTIYEFIENNINLLAPGLFISLN